MIFVMLSLLDWAMMGSQVLALLCFKAFMYITYLLQFILKIYS